MYTLQWYAVAWVCAAGGGQSSQGWTLFLATGSTERSLNQSEVDGAVRDFRFSQEDQSIRR